ncbi:FxsA family protein [Natroniella sulfidigena]|uniref:FxsA family protein n=1 Tax=Natroniella sulfidigena TaxID=723921 RepID=UPI00200B6C5D|nr:FxsA family protein [Natroniella sulfidigena]MCK8815764.1 FxsA family protein [Natroniella sulfidigena]
MVKLILLFTLVPLAELFFLIKVGEYVGIGWTILLVASTGIVGVSLAKLQGLAIIGQTKLTLARAKMPKDELVDGLLVLLGSAMLLTPGLLTDLAGFSLIVPITRVRIREVVKNKFKGKIISGNFSFGTSSTKQRNKRKKDDDETIIDIDDYQEID